MFELKKSKIFDKSVIASASNQVVRIISGPIIQLFFIPIFLTPNDQGLWFAMISLSALTIIADMGFTNIIMQFAAHEFAFLKIENKLLIGLKEKILNLSSLFYFSIRWITIISLILTPIIYFSAFLVLPSGDKIYTWLIPWTVFAFSAIYSLILNVTLSFLEGCGEISAIQGIKTVGALTSSITMILLLLLKKGLLALAFSSVLSSLVISVLLFIKYNNLLLYLFNTGKLNKLNKWFLDVIKLLGKYAISWISGYCSLQLFVPIILKTQGEIAAGKVGLSWSVISAAYSISNVWVYTSIPIVNMLIAKNEWKASIQLLRRKLVMSIGTFILGISCFIIFLVVIGDKLGVQQRFVSIGGLVIIAFGWCSQLILNTIATFLRSFKEEPFVYQSIVSAIWIVISSIYLAKNTTSDFYFISFLTSFLISLPWSVLLFKKKQHNLLYK